MASTTWRPSPSASRAGMPGSTQPLISIRRVRPGPAGAGQTKSVAEDKGDDDAD